MTHDLELTTDIGQQYGLDHSQHRIYIRAGHYSSFGKAIQAKDEINTKNSTLLSMNLLITEDVSEFNVKIWMRKNQNG